MIELFRMLNNYDTVYVIDPDEAVHDALSTLLGASDVDIRCFLTAEEFLESGVLHTTNRSCLLVEADLPGMGSLAFVRQLHSRSCKFPIVVLASTSDKDIADQALKAGAIDVFDKPLIGSRLLNLLDGVADIQPNPDFSNNL